MTGTCSRHPAEEAGEPDDGDEGRTEDRGRDDSFPGILFRPGFANVCLCYLFVLSFFLSPAALLFSFLFAERGDSRILTHYYFVRTTIALLVIGFCMSGLMIVLGAVFSSLLILTGVTLFAATAALTLIRCVSGLIFALRCKAPRNYKSYFV